jgi:hypothetical protein
LRRSEWRIRDRRLAGTKLRAVGSGGGVCGSKAVLIANAGFANSELPVVVASGMNYVPLAYYSPPALRARLFSPKRRTKGAFYEGGAMFGKNVKFLKDYMPLQVEDYTQFILQHPAYCDSRHGCNTW